MLDWNDWLAIAAFGISAASLGLSAATFIRKGRWREHDLDRTRPRFAVTATPSYSVDGAGPEHHTLSDVTCHVENISTRDATITDVGITPLTSLPVQGAVERPGGIRLPHALLPGHALSWTIPGTRFTDLLHAQPDPAPENPRFTIYVERDTDTDGQRWSSEPFTLTTRI